MAVIRELTAQALLDLTRTLAAELFTRATYPWEILSVLGEYLTFLGPTLPETLYDRIQPDVWAAKNAVIAPNAYIQGPCVIGQGVEIRHCAYIRGKVLIGDEAVIGNSTELKNCVLFNRTQVPHYNYVGDSVLGFAAHMGAGAVASNVKGDRSPIEVKYKDGKINTGLHKFGAVLGDRAEIGCGSVLNPGTVVGRNARIYPLCSVRGCVPAGSIYKNASEIVSQRDYRE